MGKYLSEEKINNEIELANRLIKLDINELNKLLEENEGEKAFIMMKAIYRTAMEKEQCRLLLVCCEELNPADLLTKTTTA